MEKKVKHKQDKPFGCGVYAIANACNYPAFINDDRLEASKKGNRVGQLSKWIQDDGNEWYLETLYYSNWGGKLPETELNYKATGECISFPILFTTAKHMVGARIFHDGTVNIYDSLKDEIIETDFTGLIEIYPNIFGIYYLACLHTGDFVTLNN